MNRSECYRHSPSVILISWDDILKECYSSWTQLIKSRKRIVFFMYFGGFFVFFGYFLCWVQSRQSSVVYFISICRWNDRILHTGACFRRKKNYMNLVPCDFEKKTVVLASTLQADCLFVFPREYLAKCGDVIMAREGLQNLGHWLRSTSL